MPLVTASLTLGKDRTGTGTFSLSATEQLMAIIQNNVGDVSNGQVTGRKTITGTLGVGALTGLRFATAAYPGGALVSRAANTDFNTATNRWQSTSNPHLTAAGSSFQIDFDFTGVGELRIYGTADNAAATMGIEISR